MSWVSAGWVRKKYRRLQILVIGDLFDGAGLGNAAAAGGALEAGGCERGWGESAGFDLGV